MTKNNLFMVGGAKGVGKTRLPLEGLTDYITGEILSQNRNLVLDTHYARYSDKEEPNKQFRRGLEPEDLERLLEKFNIFPCLVEVPLCELEQRRKNDPKKRVINMKFCIATNWDEKLHDYLVKLNSIYKKDKIEYVFGSAPFSIFGSAVANLPSVSSEEMEKKIAHLRNNGIKFNYLVNSTIFPDLTIKSNYQKALEYFDWIKRQGVEIITIGNKQLLDFVYHHFPDLKINISIAMGIKKIEEINELRKKYPNIERVTLHHTLNRNKAALIKHIKNAHCKGKLKPIKIEILANEICLYNCPRMKEHYAVLSKITQGNQAKSGKVWEWCGKKRAANVNEFLGACWIRPEDVQLYEDLGVDYIKIAGRRESTKNLKLRVQAYMNRRYNGNVMDLFMSEFWPESKPPFIDNQKLDGYVGKILDGKKPKLNISYKWKYGKPKK